MDVKIYTTPFCPYCIMAKKFLKGKNIPFQEIGVAGNREMRQKLLEWTGQHTVPQIFINDKSIGGYTDLKALDDSGKLDVLLV